MKIEQLSQFGKLTINERLFSKIIGIDSHKKWEELISVLKEILIILKFLLL